MNEFLFIILPAINVVVVVGLVGLTVGLTARSVLRQWRDRRLSGSADDLTIPLYFSGLGTQTTYSLHMRPGAYKMEYHFPPDTLVLVELVRTDTAEASRLVRKSGYGSWVFSVEHPARYVFQVETEAANTMWSFDVRLMGLRGN